MALAPASAPPLRSSVYPSRSLDHAHAVVLGCPSTDSAPRAYAHHQPPPLSSHLADLDADAPPTLRPPRVDCHHPRAARNRWRADPPPHTRGELRNTIAVAPLPLRLTLPEPDRAYGTRLASVVLVRRDGGVSGGPEAGQGGARGLRQFYLYLAFTAGGRSDPLAATAGGGLGIIGSGRSASSAETTQAREWKLDALADIFEDVDVAQAIVHVGGMTALDSVVYKLASRGLDAIGLVCLFL